MGAQGTTTADFGTGKTDVKVSVTGQSAITGTSLADAWVFPIATTNNTADDTVFDDLTCVACNVQAGVGFDIVVKCNHGFAHGIHTIGWVWN